MRTDPEPEPKARSVRRRPRRFVRTLGLLVLSLTFFVGGYLGIGLLFPNPRVVSEEEGAFQRRQVRPGIGVIGDLESVTLRSSDPKTGAVVAEILVGAYRRTSSTEVRLEDVRATALLQGDGDGDGDGDELGGIVTLTSPLGLVELTEGVEAEGEIDAGSLSSADQARLNDVTLRWFASRAEAEAGPEQALLTLRADHLVFDNERFSLYTTDTQIDGRTVLAEDVPVRVRGRDYDFDGTGLVVRWDAATRRPTFVRIAHGERLVVKTDRPFLPEGALVGRTGGTEADQRVHRDVDGRGIFLASASGDLAQSLPEPAPPILYQARLSGDVRVFRDGRTMAEADTAGAVFQLTDADEEEDGKAASPPTSEEPPASPPATAEPTPQTQPEPFSPITVRWTGPLVIEPSTERAESAVLTGSPLVLRQEGAEVRAGRLDYDPAGEVITLAPPDESTNVVLVDAEGNSLVAPRLIANRSRGVATAIGAGYAEINELAVAEPSREAASPAEPRRLRLGWQEQAEFFFAEEPDAEGDSLSLSGFVAEQAVHVTHPQFTLTSDRLAGDLEQVSGRQEVRSLNAEGSMDLALLEGAGWRLMDAPGGEDERVEGVEDAPTRLTGDRLQLDLPDGSAGPVDLLVTGNVQTIQEGERFAAERLEMRLTHSEGGSESDFQLSSLEARMAVIQTGEAGRIESPTLRLTPDAEAVPAADGKPSRRVELLGEEGAPARVSLPERGIGLLESTLIDARTGSERLVVPTAGRLELTATEPEASRPPVFVAWTERLRADHEQVEAVGEVRLDTTLEPGDAEAEGPTRMASRSHRLQLDLAPASTSTTQPVDRAQRLRRGILEGDVRSTIQVFDSDGVDLAQSFDLRSETLNFVPTATTDEGVGGFEATVPGPGRLLYRDLRPAEDENATDAQAESLGGFRGDAAFGWTESLVWEPAGERGTLTMLGDATVGIEPTEGPTCRIRSRQLDVVVSLDREDSAAQADRKGTRLKEVTFTEAVQFSSESINFSAERLRYEPETDRLIASGEGQPVVLLDADGTPTGRFRELIYNVGTGQIDRLSGLDAGQ